MNETVSQIIRLVIAAVWRRSKLAMIPLAIILPLGLGYAKFGSKVYATKSLMLLEENNRASPFANDLSMPSSLQGRIAGLQTLLKSERVLLRVMNDIEGPNAPADKKEIATWLRDFSASLSLDLVGNDFLEFQLIGKSPVGLGKQLEAVTSRFLEALLSSQDATSATQILITRKKAELDALVGEYDQLRARIASRPPTAQQAEAAALDRQEKILEEKAKELSVVAAELEKLKASAVGPESKQADKNSAASEKEVPAMVGASPSDAVDAARVSTSISAQPRRAPIDPAKLKTLEDRYASLTTDIARLERSTAGLRRSLWDGESYVQRLHELEIAVQKARESFQDYSRRFVAPIGVRSSSILAAPERIKVIDEPKDPELPMRTALRIAVGVVFASLLAAGGVVFLAELLDTTVRRENEIEQLTGAPILARLPAGDLEQSLMIV